MGMMGTPWFSQSEFCQTSDMQLKTTIACDINDPERQSSQLTSTFQSFLYERFVEGPIGSNPFKAPLRIYC